MRTVTKEDNPILIIDGGAVNLNRLNGIDINDIEKIEIIKNGMAMALFGSEGVNGAIWITTKHRYKKIIIKDALDQTPVAAATMSFDFQGRENSLRYIADENGFIFSNSWKELAQSVMNVSAVGYQTYHRETPGDDSVIYLQRDIKTCEIVIPTQSYCPKRIGCCSSGNCRCGRIILKADSNSVNNSGSYSTLTGFSIYPNPVQKGTSITIRLTDTNSVSIVRVLSLDGRNLLQRPIARVQKSIFRLETDPRWAAGIYFVQLLYENGRVAASEKIIIQ
ncbi:MAG: T9SS type A sorting domain-containing protein [Chitinophagaceae bacterium]